MGDFLYSQLTTNLGNSWDMFMFTDSVRFLSLLLSYLNSGMNLISPRETFFFVMWIVDFISPCEVLRIFVLSLPFSICHSITDISGTLVLLRI